MRITSPVNFATDPHCASHGVPVIGTVVARNDLRVPEPQASVAFRKGFGAVRAEVCQSWIRTTAVVVIAKRFRARGYRGRERKPGKEHPD
jgi:hypothetical protein